MASIVPSNILVDSFDGLLPKTSTYVAEHGVRYSLHKWSHVHQLLFWKLKYSEDEMKSRELN